ncbi:MAG TPA: tRNA uridine-5-carboxymethylaminomethyl(34) synthesis GTPase MnmE [Candidatus Kapabacteria bacterium]|nr:tRNA uridine-5-carboxymethylaminomethyl(34) synthesis GTPase MnmE [Candidatus Kapabacteria bacterium]
MPRTRAEPAVTDMLQDTIAAISTPLGESGLAVVRLSGLASLRIADSCFRPVGSSSKSASAAGTHTVQYGKMKRDGKTIDEVLLTVLRAPRTFTREDMVEISCHGGILPAKLVLDALLAAGARLAEPGEFTKRAFLNGRIDLTQAEAVADLIHSRTELALDAANEQLAGKLSRRIEELRDQLVQTLAHIEAHIDFPDEDIAPDTKDQLIRRLESGLSFMDQLLATASEGQILRRGIRAAIIGRPNAGKSSLLNQLLGHERAIVSPVPGTTRDTIEETANIRGIPVVFVDTAGIRDSNDLIEAEGIRRSRESLARAELVLEVIDASEAVKPGERIGAQDGKKHLLVLNKIDLPQRAQVSEPAHRVSCTSGEGLEQLKDAIRDAVWSGRVGGEMNQVMINARHQEALQRARHHTRHTIDALRSNQTLELSAMDLRIATNAIGEIVGKTTTEHILDSIFSQFCIGK